MIRLGQTNFIYLLVFTSLFTSCKDGGNISYDSNRVPYRKGNMWGFADRDLDLVIKPIYDAVTFFKGNTALVKFRGKWGMIDEAGEELTAAIYDTILAFSEGLAGVQLNGQWGFINEEGQKNNSL